MARDVTPASVRLFDAPQRIAVPETGATESIQRADVILPEATLERLWSPEYLERLARAYWVYLNRISLGLFRVVYEPDARTVVAGFRRFALLRFRAPEYATSSDGGSVTWRIERGLLVAKEGRGHGYLRIAVERCGPAEIDGQVRVRVRVEVKNFYPWLRGSGRFARFGTWVYSHTQARMHILVTHGFLRSLSRLELPPSKVGVLRAEIAGPLDGAPRADRGDV